MFVSTSAATVFVEILSRPSPVGRIQEFGIEGSVCVAFGRVIETPQSFLWIVRLFALVNWHNPNCVPCGNPFYVAARPNTVALRDGLGHRDLVFGSNFRHLSLL